MMHCVFHCSGMSGPLLVLYISLRTVFILLVVFGKCSWIFELLDICNLKKWRPYRSYWFVASVR